MTTFLYENGDDKVFDEHEKEIHVYEMEIDIEQYPLEQLTTHEQYIGFKSPEKPIRIKIEAPEEEIADWQTLRRRIASREYRSYKGSDKKKFFSTYMRRVWVYIRLLQNLRYRYKQLKDGRRNSKIVMMFFFTRKEGSGRPRGRSAILNEEHQKHLIELIDENPSLVLDQIMESLTSQFEGHKVSKTSLYDFIK